MTYNPDTYRRYYEENREEIKAVMRNRYHSNPEYKKRNRLRKQQMKLKVIEALGLEVKCYRCGYDRCVAALDFHHIDRTTKRGSVANLYTLEEKVEEAKKCQLLCANCHRETEAEQTSVR